MENKELFELAKKFGDNYTYGQIVQTLKENFIPIKEVDKWITNEGGKPYFTEGNAPGIFTKMTVSWMEFKNKISKK